MPKDQCSAYCSGQGKLKGVTAKGRVWQSAEDQDNCGTIVLGKHLTLDAILLLLPRAAESINHLD